jgi:hypothetical protein
LKRTDKGGMKIMPVEEALTYIIAVSVPVWLAVEQVLVRRRAARERQRQAAAADRSNLLAARSVNPSPHGTESSRRAA